MRMFNRMAHLQKCSSFSDLISTTDYGNLGVILHQWFGLQIRLKKKKKSKQE